MRKKNKLILLKQIKQIINNKYNSYRKHHMGKNINLLFKI